MNSTNILLNSLHKSQQKTVLNPKLESFLTNQHEAHFKLKTEGETFIAEL